MAILIRSGFDNHNPQQASVASQVDPVLCRDTSFELPSRHPLRNALIHIRDRDIGTHIKIKRHLLEYVTDRQDRICAAWDQTMNEYYSLTCLSRKRRRESFEKDIFDCAKYAADSATLKCALLNSGFYEAQRAPIEAKQKYASAVQPHLSSVAFPDLAARSLRNCSKAADVREAANGFALKLLDSSACDMRLHQGVASLLPACCPVSFLRREDPRTVLTSSITYLQDEKSILNQQLSKGRVPDLLGNVISWHHLSAVSPQWTDLEKIIYLDKFLQHPKNFSRIAMFLSKKRARDCVRLYYDSKYLIDYKALLREHQQRRRGKKISWDVTRHAVRAFGGDLQFDSVRNLVWFKLPLAHNISPLLTLRHLGHRNKSTSGAHFDKCQQDFCRGMQAENPGRHPCSTNP